MAWLRRSASLPVRLKVPKPRAIRSQFSLSSRSLLLAHSSSCGHSASRWSGMLPPQTLILWNCQPKYTPPSIRHLDHGVLFKETDYLA